MRRRLCHSRGALLLCGFVLLVALRGQARVFVFDTEVEARMLAEPLRIQLGSDVVQMTEPALTEVPTAQRRAIVEQALRSSSEDTKEALVGVWLEASPQSQQGYAVFLVKLRSSIGRASYEEYTLPPDAQSERSLALTIAEAYRALDTGPDQPAAPPRTTTQNRTVAVRSSYRAARVLLAGGQLVRAPLGALAPLLSFQLIGGARFIHPVGGAFTAYLGGFLQIPRSDAIPGGYVVYSERCALLGLSARFPLGSLELGGLSELRATQLRTHASADMREGQVTLVEWSAALRALAAFRLSSHFSLELSAGTAVQFRPRRFTVFGEKAAELPRLVPEAGLLLQYLL